ncbi:MAG: MaoC family dehydratase [Hyphomonadaceae bacterium]
MSGPEKIHVSDLPNAVGKEFVSDWVLVDQKRINEFADVTDDHNFVHVDLERARALRGHTIAHGLLTMTLLPGLSYKLLEVTGCDHALNYGLEKVRFTGIVPVDTRVRLRLKIKSVEKKGAGIVLTNQFTFEREGEEKPAVVGESLGMFFAKAA